MRVSCFLRTFRTNKSKFSRCLTGINQKNGITSRVVAFSEVPFNSILSLDISLPQDFEYAKHKYLFLKSLLKNYSLKNILLIESSNNFYKLTRKIYSL